MLPCVRNLECKRSIAAMILLLSDCTVLADRVDALREERILIVNIVSGDYLKWRPMKVVE